MQQKNLEVSFKKIKDASIKRNFKQSIELVINLKGLNLKKTEEQVDFFVTLHFNKGKPTKICALVGPELADEAKANCDFVIEQSDFIKYAKEKKLSKKLAGDFEFFIAQANIMPQVAQTFGRVFGPRAKMPNPKAGCVVPPKANLAPLVAKLKKTVRVAAKVQPLIQCSIGTEDMKDSELIDNLITLYNQILHHLPAGTNNIRTMFLKMTMGPAMMVDFNGSIVESASTEKNADAVKSNAKKTKKTVEKTKKDE